MTELRYPYEAIHEKTDYLSIQILEYTASGIGNKELEKPKIGEKPGFLRLGSGDYIKDNSEGRLRLAAEQGLLQGFGSKFSPPKRITTANQLRETIYLPIPPNIQDGNSVTFGAGEMDGLTAQILGIVLGSFDLAGQGDIMGALKSVLLETGSTILSQPAKDYFLRNLATSAANIPFGGNLSASQLLARETGKILNPNMELLFSGVNLRSFKFSFKMTPRNRKEAIRIRNIIRTLKKNMTPKEEGVYLGSPNIFKLQYRQGNKPHPFLHKFKECALTDMSVNYTGEGTYATYGDDLRAPVSMVMDLGFKELEPVYAGDYVDDTSENRQNKSYIEDLHGGVGY